jgi:KipI family sensor histidine kinase inhibitor
MSKTSGNVARFVPASDQSLMVYLGESITLEAHQRVLKFLRLLEREPVPSVRNVHPGYCSVLVKFDALECTHLKLEAVLRGYLVRLETVKIKAARLVEIPVCYGGASGPDMADVCEMHGLTAEQIVERHCAAEYLVYFLGFVPGFAYLGPGEDRRVEEASPLRGPAGLERGRPFVSQGQPALPGLPATPRLVVPRKRVPVGSVGIAGEQTGVYPFATPGGWRLIGRTPMQMFRASNARSVLTIGDRVRFVAISAERFAEMEAGAA